jgi:hypothetical protein
LKEFTKGTWGYLVIRGFADKTGSTAYNLKLSRRRSQSVCEFLGDIGVDTAKISYSYFGKEELRFVQTTDDYQSQNRRVEIIRVNNPVQKSDKPNPQKEDAPKSENGLSFKDLEANALFFLLDLICTLLLIPVVLNFMDRDKTKHLTDRSLTAINELMEVGGSMLIKFNDTAYKLYKLVQAIKQMTPEERKKRNLEEAQMIAYQNENHQWFSETSQNFETELNSFRATIELFSPHLKNSDLLVLISKLNQNARYGLGSMKVITFSMRVGGRLPDEAFGDINRAYENMYDLVVEAQKNKKFK